MKTDRLKKPSKLFCASMMCVDYDNLSKTVKKLDHAGIDTFHCDIMDGCFVPNFAMGINDIKTIRNNTKKPIDCHLMMEDVANKVDWFIDAGVDIVYIHPETDRFAIKTLQHIKERNAFAGIAVSPDTSCSSILELLNYCDYVMVMTVNPGFAGQKILPYIGNKITELNELKNKYTYKLIIDGHCTKEIIQQYSAIGVNGFVLGTSSLFINNTYDYNLTIKNLREL